MVEEPQGSRDLGTVRMGSLVTSKDAEGAVRTALDG